MLFLQFNVSKSKTSMVLASCTVRIAVMLLLIAASVVPTGSFCTQFADSLPPNNLSICYVVIPPPSEIRTYSGGYQNISLVVSDGCIKISEDQSSVNPDFTHSEINGYLCASLLLSNISTNDTIVITVFGDISANQPHSQYETNILVQDMEFSYRIECDKVVYFWTLIPGFTYSLETVCNGNTSEYTNLTNSSFSLDIIEGQESCTVLLVGKRQGGGSPEYLMDVVLIQDPSGCIESERLDGQWNLTDVQLTYFLTLSCHCLPTQPTTIYISTGYENSTNTSCEKDVEFLQYSILVCISGGGILASYTSPTDNEIKVVVDVQLIDSSSVLHATAISCNPAGCSNGTTITIDGVTLEPSTYMYSTDEATLKPTTGQTDVPASTHPTPDSGNDWVYWIVIGVTVGLVLAGLVFALILCVIITKKALCVYHKSCEQKKRKQCRWPQTIVPADLRAGKSSTQTTTASDPGIEVRVDNNPPRSSPEEGRRELTLTRISGRNSAFFGGGVEGVGLESENPKAAPSQEQEPAGMVCSNGVVKKSFSTGSLRTFLSPDNISGAFSGAFPADTFQRVSHPPRTLPNHPPALYTNEAKEYGKETEQDTVL